MDVKMYRALSVGSSVCKLTIDIILGRLQNWYSGQISDFQNGFVANKGTSDGIFLVKRIQQLTKLARKKAFMGSAG